MTPDFWMERWQQNQIGFHEKRPNVHLQTHWRRLEVPTGATVFVPLCGKSQDLLWLRGQGLKVVGVELSDVAAHDFFAENGLASRVTTSPPFDCWQCDGITIWCGDFFALTPEHLREVSAVYDRAALIALPPPMRQRYVAKLAEVLPPRTQTLLVTLSYAQEQMSGPPFSVPESEVRALYEPQHRVERLASEDILEQETRFRERGVRELLEEAYWIRDGAAG